MRRHRADAGPGQDAGGVEHRHRRRRPDGGAVLERPFTGVLDDLAARTPAPGGGSGAALSCALAAALVEMVGAFGSGAAAEAIAAAAAPLRARAGELAELDLVSYGGVLEALKRDKDDLERPAALAAALSAACDIPLETAQIASETCRLAARATDGANRWLTGDAIAAAQIALGACRAAAALVAVNLSDVTDDRPAQAAQYVAEAEVACQHAMSKTTKS